MDLRQLLHFKHIAESGSISAASATLHIAQPALSRQMRALEDELGAKLFFRTGRGVMPTPAGQALLTEARFLLGEADRINKQIRRLGTRLTGEATIGLSPTIGRLLTIPLARRVQSDYPGLKLRIAEAFSGTLLEWLQAGRIDAAILYHRPTGGSVQSEIVAHEPLSVLAGGENMPFPAGESVPMSRLSDQPLILPTPQHGLRKMIDDHAAAQGVTLDLMFEFDSLDATIALVREGSALTILPESAVRAELAAGTLRAWRIGTPPLVRPLIIATATQRADAIGVQEAAVLLKGIIQSNAQARGWQVARPGTPLPG
ncbi:LysR family transcriptional regulator [Sphingomonas tagetis]|nr:LysR family transcriptional regulator [Sphingomonas tagetis]